MGRSSDFVPERNYRLHKIVMKYEAVIFDLFGTLIDVFSKSEYEDVMRDLASALGASFDDFKTVWYETFHERSTGIVPTNRANLEYICRKLGVQADDEKIERAAKIRHEFFAYAMKPRQDAIDVLSELRSQGMKTALISNCSPVAAEVWPDTPFAPLFDTVVFSCSAHIKKPDPRIYQMAIEPLAVKPENCLYIGDGSGNELAGAKEMGMHPMMICVDYEGDPDFYITDRQKWDGPVISTLTEVLNLVK
ncbi:HAD family hydrolase [Chloroflexota bacterium]